MGSCIQTEAEVEALSNNVVSAFSMSILCNMNIKNACLEVHVADTNQ